MNLTRCRKHKLMYKASCPLCWADEQVKENGPAEKVAEHTHEVDKVICKRHTTKHDPTCRFCNAELAEENVAKKQAAVDHCKGCVWLNKNGGAPFCGAVNCVREHGWVAEDSVIIQRCLGTPMPG